MISRRQALVDIFKNERPRRDQQHIQQWLQEAEDNRVNQNHEKCSWREEDFGFIDPFDLTLRGLAPSIGAQPRKIWNMTLALSIGIATETVTEGEGKLLREYTGRDIANIMRGNKQKSLDSTPDAVNVSLANMDEGLECLLQRRIADMRSNGADSARLDTKLRDYTHRDATCRAMAALAVALRIIADAWIALESRDFYASPAR